MGDAISSFWPLGVIVAGLVVLIFLSRALLSGGEQPLPYVCRASLLTAAEQTFHKALVDAVGGRWIVLAMVRLADVLEVREGTAERADWQGKINSKHLDFVLCEHSSLAPKLAIELDDSTHARPDRAERDRFLEAGLASAGLPLLRIAVAPSYDVKELKKVLGK